MIEADADRKTEMRQPPVSLATSTNAGLASKSECPFIDKKDDFGRDGTESCRSFCCYEPSNLNWVDLDCSMCEPWEYPIYFLVPLRTNKRTTSSHKID
jgi:hypothetical protein